MQIVFSLRTKIKKQILNWSLILMAAISMVACAKKTTAVAPAASVEVTSVDLTCNGEPCVK